jgi:hypothetical protein
VDPAGLCGRARAGDCAGAYAALIYRFGHGALPLGRTAVLLDLLWAPAIVLGGLAALLYPDGTVPSARWRWVLRAYLMAGVGLPVLMGHDHVDSSAAYIHLAAAHVRAAYDAARDRQRAWQEGR